MRVQKLSLGLVILTLAALLTSRAQAQQPVVRAVLFYSPTCGHCHYVITEVLPPLGEKYGAQLQIAGVDITGTTGQVLYQSAIEHFNIPDERRGVPLLVVEETTLVGSQEIPEKFPQVIEQVLAAGGSNWPTIPGLAEAMAASEPTPVSTPDPTSNQAVPVTPDITEVAVAQTASTSSGLTETTFVQPDAGSVSPGNAAFSLAEISALNLGEKLSRDPAGNMLAIVLLVAMLAVFSFAVVRAVQAWPGRSQGLPPDSTEGWRDWAVAGLCLVGLGVSIYMAFVETTHAPAVCGPVGDCNTVQQSEYALLFGWLPIGVLGALGYAAMLVVWVGRRWGRGKLSHNAELALFGMALFGTLFSIYLTFLEPFVIGATCIWCLTSALCMTLILLILAGSVSVRPEPVRQPIRGV